MESELRTGQKCETTGGIRGHREVGIEPARVQDVSDIAMRVTQHESSLFAMEPSMERDQLAKGRASHHLHHFQAQHDVGDLIVFDEGEQFLAHLLDVFVFGKLRTSEPRGNSVAVIFNRQKCRLISVERHDLHPHVRRQGNHV